MSEQSSILDALKTAGAPDYMVIIITEVVEAKDAIREMMAKLSARAVELNQREQVIENREQLLEERQSAFMNAADDMKEFANRLYGPDSELTKINSKLGAIEASGINRDKRYADQYQAISDNQTRLRDWVETRVSDVEKRVTDVERDVADLKRKSA